MMIYATTFAALSVCAPPWSPSSMIIGPLKNGRTYAARPFEKDQY